MTSFADWHRATTNALAAQWTCAHHTLCYANVADGGRAIAHHHWSDCPFSEPRDEDVRPHEEMTESALIDLRARRTIQLPPRTEVPRDDTLTESDEHGE